MTNHAQNALDAKLEQIEALVKCLEIKQAQEVQEDLQALLEELKKAKDESLDLKTQIEVAEQDFAQIEGKFKKYQASVDAGYDDKETLALRDSHGYELEEIHEEWLELLRQHGQVMQEVSELGALSANTGVVSRHSRTVMSHMLSSKAPKKYKKPLTQ
jgi:predicted  nucleic acid-binding Zn-ribbon protein